MYQKRIQHLREKISLYKSDFFLITNPKNIFYLTGFTGVSPQERESILLLTPDEITLFVPEMYSHQAGRLSSVVQKEITLAVDTEKQGLFSLALSGLTRPTSILCESNNLTLAEMKRLQQLAPQLVFQPESGIVEALRCVKDETELQFLSQAATISDQVFTSVVSVLQRTDYTTLSEHDVKNMFRELGQEFGADDFGFDPIIAVGENSAEPHYHTNKTPLRANTTLLFDFGFTYQGYTSDISRTIFLGKPDEEFIRIYNLIRECHDLCLHGCRPGVPVKDLYQISVDFFRQHGVEKNYLHSLGHGLGLNVHEAPSVGNHDQTILTEDMVITIEPGLYLPGNFGVRIEDDVIITTDGCEVLTRSITDLLVIDKYSV